LIFHILFAGLTRFQAADEVNLILKVSRRDEKAFETLYDLYGKLLYSLILSIVKRQSDAEDVLQETFFQVWEKARTFDAAKGNTYSWLVALARNRAIDRIRSKSFRNQKQTDSEVDTEPIKALAESGPLDALMMQERAALVKNALQQIPREQREVIEIAYFDGYSQSEIAEHLNIPLGTVKTRMRQGMKKLHALLRERI
jgi:RNA polymerase sigma-70 factor (ECF subfamily)